MLADTLYAGYSNRRAAVSMSLLSHISRSASAHRSATVHEGEWVGPRTTQDAVARGENHLSRFDAYAHQIHRQDLSRDLDLLVRRIHKGIGWGVAMDGGPQVVL